MLVAIEVAGLMDIFLISSVDASDGVHSSV